MAWTSEFITFISGSQIELSWYVRSIRSNKSGSSGEWGGTFTAATERSRLSAHADIVPNSVQTTGPRLNESTWTASGGSFSFACTSYLDVIYRLTRGDVLILALMIPGTSTYMDIAFGVVSQISSNGTGQASISCLDGMAILRNRLTTDIDEVNLFYDVNTDEDTPGASINNTSGFTTSNTTMTLDELSSQFGFDGVKGAVRVTVGSSSFLVTFTKRTGFTLTGCATAFGSTRIAAPKGSRVTEVALLRGTPHDVFARVLTSTGKGTNGTPDIYPASWGLGLPKEYLDTSDLYTWRDQYIDHTGASDSSWDVLAEAEEQDGFQFLAAAWKLGGFFPVIKQGRFTMHHASRFISGDVRTHILITDDDIAAGASAIEYQAFRPTQPIEYSKVLVTGTFRSFTDPAFGVELFNSGDIGIEGLDKKEVAMLPSYRELLINLVNPAVPDASMIGNANSEPGLSLATDVIERVGTYAQRVGERLRLRCAGLRLAQLSVGEFCYLTTSRFRGRSDSAGPVNQKACLVTAVDTDWGGGSVSVELYLKPNYEGAYP